MAEKGKYYFVSDLHLGASDPEGARERAFVAFLRNLPADVRGLFILGDLFDFWVDYREVVPRGHVRVLAALADIAERSDVWFFRGNHDWWTTDYFEKELGIKVVGEDFMVMDLDGCKVCMGHGDTVGAENRKARMTGRLFRNKLCIALMKSLPTRWVFPFARRWSASSRSHHAGSGTLPGRDSAIYRFADAFGRGRDIDRYVFGHWHTPARIPVESGGELVLLGAWKGEADTYVL